MAKFHSLTVSNIRKETDDCVSISFNIPDNLKEEFRFIQGQYVTLKMNIEGEELRRSYSLCSSPIAENDFRIASKKVSNGKVSNFLFERLKVGDSLEVMTPMGNFYSKLDPSHSKNYLLFAGGSGITPVFSIIKTVLNVEKDSTIKLFFGNKDESSVIFKEALNDLEKKHSGRFGVYHIFEKPQKPYSPDLTGLLTREKTEELLSKHVEMDKPQECFICGPLPMMNNIKDTLEKFQVPKESIHIEYFTTVLEDIARAEKVEIQNNIPETISNVTVILDGSETTFKIKSTGKSILDTCIDNDLDVPFACKGAVCCTCKAKIISGKVTMDMNYALTSHEVTMGYILTCQSHPQSENVTVSYDEI